MSTVAGLLRDACAALATASPTPQLDASLLLADSLEKNTTWLKTWPESEVPVEQAQRFAALLRRRVQGEPIAYILGWQSFWTLDLQVSPDTLIPRPETELLVEKVLELMPADQTLSVMDLGTGSGAIALALASERPGWRIVGCDRSAGALAMAQRNQQRLGLKVAWQASDWFAQIPAQLFDVVVSNPPYVETHDPHLENGDVRFEPLSALVSGDDGLQDIRRIVAEARDYLRAGGLLIMEHGYNQAESVRALLSAAGYVRVESCLDLAGHERATLGFWSEQS